MIRRAVLLSFVALTSLAACASESKDVVVVSASDTECDAAQTEFAAGDITFEVKNEGSKVTELYVYGKGDKVISEVDNVGPGASRKLSVSLKEGDYELACKPGMTGRGIRVPIEVTGSGGEQGAEDVEADREIHVIAVDHSFSFEDGDPKIKVGETIEFELINKGTHPHEFEVFGPDGKVLGEVEEVDPGKEGKANITFATAGTYRYECHVEDHFERGMKGELAVS